MSHSRVLGLIPARSGSKRVAGKNSRPLAGKPLAEWTIDAAIAAKGLGRILLSTDDPVLLELGRARGIEILERPAELASDTAGSVDVALHALEYEAREGRVWDVVCLLQPTSPFRPAGRIDEGLRLLLQNPSVPAVVGVQEALSHPFHCFIEGEGGLLMPACERQEGLQARTQDLPLAFALTGSFYAIRSGELARTRSFVPPGSLSLRCEARGESIDIDTPEDFDSAQRIAKLLAGSL